jgi:hypothetical protein
MLPAGFSYVARKIVFGMLNEESLCPRPGVGFVGRMKRVCWNAFSVAFPNDLVHLHARPIAIMQSKGCGLKPAPSPLKAVMGAARRATISGRLSPTKPRGNGPPGEPAGNFPREADHSEGVKPWRTFKLRRGLKPLIGRSGARLLKCGLDKAAVSMNRPSLLTVGIMPKSATAGWQLARARWRLVAKLNPNLMGSADGEPKNKKCWLLPRPVAMADRSPENPQDLRILVRIVSVCTLGLWAFAGGLLLEVFLFW